MLEQRAKQWLIGTALGRLLMSGRDSLRLVELALSSPENLGMVVNDNLAARLVTRLARGGATFVDVGAHLGSIIAAVAQHDPSVRIVAVEAIPEKAERLLRKFPAVRVHACAVGDQDGEVPFFVHIRQSGYSSLGRPEKEDREGALREIRVPLRRLDDLVEHSGVDVVKIDVEGAELGVLRGATRLLAASRPVVMFESGEKKAAALRFTEPAVWQLLTELGYTLHVPNRVGHDDDGLSLEGFVESHTHPRRTTNYFAIPRERRLEVRDRARALLGIRSE